MFEEEEEVKYWVNEYEEALIKEVEENETKKKKKRKQNTENKSNKEKIK